MESREVAAWFVGVAALLGLLVVGQPLLVPLAFSLLLWAVVNAMVQALVSLRVPRALAFAFALLLLLSAIWLILQIVGDQADGLEHLAPERMNGLTQQGIVASQGAPHRLGMLFPESLYQMSEKTSRDRRENANSQMTILAATGRAGCPSAASSASSSCCMSRPA